MVFKVNEKSNSDKIVMNRTYGQHSSRSNNPFMEFNVTSDYVSGNKAYQSNKVRPGNYSSVNQIDSIGGVKNCFETYTIDLMVTKHHSTKLLDVAQSYLGKCEVSEYEFNHVLTPAEKNNCQWFVIKGKGSINDQFCAHTVSTIAKEAGISIGGHKSSVSQFIQWATSKGTWKPIATNSVPVSSRNNIKSLRDQREAQIKKQIPNMKEGDFIVWKSPNYAVLTEDGYKKASSSHIGIIEHVDLNAGTVTVIEGNANEYLSGPNQERVFVKTKEQGVNGGQKIGEFQEINRRDGIIRKTYSITDLARFGYSGYIDNSKIVK